MKRIRAIIFSLILLLVSAVAILPVVRALGANLIANPSAETNVSNVPSGWSNNKWGTNTTAFTYATTGHTGTHSLKTNVTAYTDGDAKWFFTPVTVTPNTSYTFSDWYQSTAISSVDVVVTTTSGTDTYLYQGDQTVSAAWKQATYTFTTPANASKITVYHYLERVGALTTDDYSLATTNGNPTAPTVSVTAPAANATVSNTVTLSANASDAVAVSNVQFKIDGTNVGAADTTSPYSISWDSKTVANGSHTVTAVATNSSNLSTTSSPIAVTVNNTVIPPTAPTVSVTAPAANATVAGTVALSASASDTIGMKNVQFKVDGTNVGAADTTSPYSINWDSKTVTNGAHTITAVATNTSNLTTTSSPVSITVNNVVPTPPTVSVTAPAASSTVSGTTTLSANASDTIAVANVQFKIDGVNVGAPDTTAPYSISWDSKTVTNAAHTVTAVATNTNSLSTTSSPVSFTVNNPTPPTVSVTAPAASSTVSGTTNLTANASDAVSVSSVQFKIDGANVGAADTTAPYSLSWDSKTVANGSHTVSATATNGSNLSTTSTAVTFTVNNVIPPTNGPNLIANPSFETSANGTSPDNWQSSSWGSNTSTFSYQTTGHTGNRSARVQTTQYSDGSANWFYADLPVTAGKTYQYSNWYQSNVDTEVDAEVVMNDGTIQYFWLGTVFANTNWTQYKSTFTPPAGAKSVAIYQLLAKVGYINSDDYSLAEYTPTPYNRGIVTVTFDDGWANQYTNARPVLNSLGIKSTYYIISGELSDPPDYMSGTQVSTLYAEGNEIASHTVTHPDMTTLTQTQLVNQFANSQTTLQNLIGAPVTNFAYPFGAYNANTIATGKTYYASQRSVNGGYNTRDSLDVTQLKIHEVDANISQAQVKGWIDGAIAQHAWLILVYHEVATSPAAPDDALYTTQPADFTAEMNYLKGSGVSIQTVKQALAEVQSQP